MKLKQKMRKKIGKNSFKTPAKIFGEAREGSYIYDVNEKKGYDIFPRNKKTKQ